MPVIVRAGLLKQTKSIYVFEGVNRRVDLKVSPATGDVSSFR